MRKILSTFLMIILSVTYMYGQTDIQQQIAKSGGASDYKGAHELTIFDSTNVFVKESGLSYVHVHSLTKILDEQGAKTNNVYRVDYDPLSAHVDILMAKIYRKNGTIEDIDIASQVFDYAAPARAIYWGARQQMIQIGRLEPGDAIEIKYFRKGFTYALLYDDDESRFIPPMKGQFYDIIPFWSNHPIIKKVYEVSLPKDKLMQYKIYNGDLQSSFLIKEDRLHYHFEKENIQAVKHEQGMLANNDVFTKLLMSTSPDWEAKSMWFYGVNEDFGSFESTPDIDKKVAEILVGAENEMDSIAALTHWVADNMRYSGISMGEGEGYTLHNGEMNFTDRCGVCKDKAGLLITMLRAAGFQSYAAMTMAGERIDRIPADQFNHSVTIVKKHDGTYMILDPTWVPGVRELWSSLEQQQNYLMGLPDGADLMITPVSPPENHYLKIIGSSKIDDEGTLIGEFIVNAEGQSDAAVRGVFNYSQKAEWHKNVEMELLRIAPNAIIKELEYTKNEDYQKQPVLIQFEYEIPDFALVTEHEIIFTPLLAKNIFARAMSHLYANTSIIEREFPFRDRCSRLMEIKEDIKLPAYKKVIALPTNEKVNGEHVQFEGKYILDGRNLELTETAVYGKRIYDVSDWPYFRDAVLAQKKFADQRIILKR